MLEGQPTTSWRPIACSKVDLLQRHKTDALEGKRKASNIWSRIHIRCLAWKIGQPGKKGYVGVVNLFLHLAS